MSSPAPGTVGTIYLLHFEGKLHHAGHYMGFTTKTSEDRAVEHMTGKGSPLVAAAINAGCTVELARTWEGTRTDERTLKNKKNARALCPKCKAAYNATVRDRMRAYRARSVVS